MKKLIAGILSITLTFGSFALPAEVTNGFSKGSVITASAEEYGDLTYNVLSDGTIEISGASQYITDTVIPSTINGRKVTRIGDYAFCNNKYITSITIPDGVTSIGEEAFGLCNSLTSISLPNTVKSIGSAAFDNCRSLKKIVIPNSVTSMGEGIFYCCISLESVTISNNVTSIGKKTFCCCDNLKSIVIPNSVRSIGAEAFAASSNLTEIKIGSGVSTIEDEFCNGCYRLSSITVDSNNKYYSSKDGILFNKNKTTLVQCPPGNTRTSYSIPSTVQKIAADAFEDCNKIKSITFPSSVKTVGPAAFSGCSALKNITLPSNLQQIGNSAFYGIGISSVTIPKSVTSIGIGVFYGCSNLTNITVNSGNSKYSSKDGVLFNKDKTELVEYPLANARTSYSIPSTVRTIRCCAFSECKNIKNITIPNGVTKIEQSAFRRCENLVNVTIPESVTDIEYEAFGYCYNLQSATIYANIQQIRSSTFFCCENLKSITIPSSVTGIGSSAFAYCDNLKDVYYTGTKAQWNKISITSSGNSSLNNANMHYNTPVKKTVAKVSVKSTYTYAPDAVRINWNKVSGASGYKVFMYNDSTKKWDVVGRIFNNNTFNFRKAGLKSGKAYKFKVQAFVKSGNNYYYGATSNTISTATSPATVKVSKSNSANDAVRIYWNKVSCSGYKVQQYNASSKKWVTIAKVSGTTTNYRVSGLKRKTSYKFRVQPYQANGAGGYSYGAVSNTYTAKTK